MINDGAINNILRISSTNVLDTKVDFNLQIISLNLQSKQHNIQKEFDLYTCTLGDTKYSYSGFIIPVKKDQKNPKEGDIIKITKISTSKLTYNNCKIIIVKSYEIIKTPEEKNNNLIQVESYQDIQNKISEESKILTIEKQEKFDNHNTSNNNAINASLNKEQENKKKIKVEYKIINPEDIDMKTILDLSQISTFTKNIALYVRLTRKNIPKSFYNKISQKEGKLLTFDLIDKNGSQMQAVIFDDVIEKFSPILKEGNIYYIKGGHAKFNDKRFTTIKTDYKLYFDFNTQIMEVDKNLDNLFNKEEEKLNITKFVDLINCEQTKLVNCISYVLQSFPGLAKSSNKGKNYLIRKLVLCDSSMFKVQFTMWNRWTELDIKEGDILLLQNVKINNFNNNISISTVDKTNIEINPDLSNENYKEYDELQKVVNDGINKEDIKYISEYNITNTSPNADNRSLGNNKIIYISSLIKQLYDRYNNNINSNNQNDVSMNFTIKATVLEFEHSDKNYYYACPNCKKKLVQNDDKFTCPVCESQISDAKLNYFLTLRVMDITGEHGINLFGDQVNNLFGIDAKSYSNLIENKEQKKLEEITNSIEYHCFYFNGKANIIKYGTRLKTQLFVYRFEKEDFTKEKKRIFGDIKNVLNSIDE